MVEYSYNSMNDEQGDFLVDKILEGGGHVIGDFYEGELILGKALRRKIILEFDALIVEANCSATPSKEVSVAVAIFANDGQKQLLMESSGALLKYPKAAMAVIIDYNKIVKSALAAANQAAMKRNQAVMPLVSARKK